jgi:hypothetical protein
LIDWIGALIQAGVPESEVASAIPFLGALIKRHEDLELVESGGRTVHYSARDTWR